MSTSTNFTTKEWHGKDVFCWYRSEAIKHKGRTQTFVEIEKGRIIISELLLEKKKTLVCAVYSAPYREEIVESSRMSEAFVVNKGKMVGSADSMQGTLNHLLSLMSQDLGKSYKQVYLMLPSGTFFYKMENYPQMPDSDLKSAIKNSKTLFSETKLKKEPGVIKHWHLGTIERRDSLAENFLFVGIPKANIMNYLEMLGDAKASIAGFTTPQLLYFYYLNEQQQKNPSSFIFVELTNNNLRIYFFQTGILTFIRYIGLGKWKDESHFIRNVSSQIHHSILYLNQQYPDASLDQFVLLNKSAVLNVTEQISAELEFSIQQFDFNELAVYSPDLQEKMDEYHICITSPLYVFSISQKNESIHLPLQEFDSRIQSKIRFKAAGIFLIFWLVVLGFGNFQLKNIVDKQKKVLLASADTTEKARQIQEEQGKIEEEKNKNVARYVALQKFLKAKSHWLTLWQGILAAKSSDMSFSQFMLAAQPQKDEQAEDDNPINKVLAPKQLEVELRIFQTYSNALISFENYKNRLKPYYDIVREKIAPIDQVVGKEGVAFSLTIRLKKEKNNEEF